MAVTTKRTKAPPQLLVATTDFHADGRPEIVRAGITRILADHPLAKAYPQYFMPARESAVEQATAAPGELRE